MPLIFLWYFFQTRFFIIQGAKKSFTIRELQIVFGKLRIETTNLQENCQSIFFDD